jgi:hypothetical protein
MQPNPIGILFMALTILLVIIAATVPAIQQRRQSKKSE